MKFGMKLEKVLIMLRRVLNPGIDSEGLLKKDTKLEVGKKDERPPIPPPVRVSVMPSRLRSDKPVDSPGMVLAVRSSSFP